ncbi:hypothetical protein UFOVP218_28 [uncultured Caudovirales phage]|uniref:Uncharacterized protein n=1 Tax=uncultured Caudovirales phage TaxID=2100421 RepID=A0A6J7WL49_9CAUD|nr:hypothetical protein UFOVP218_28 [uncultured Caudovirales phage]
MQNSAVGMTKEQYFEMCETLGSEPIESEIPVEFEDFPPEMQLALSIYKQMRDEWEYMGGNYLGKNLNGIFELFEVYGIETEDKRYYLELIHTIDSIRIIEIRKQKS